MIGVIKYSRKALKGKGFFQRIEIKRQLDGK